MYCLDRLLLCLGRVQTDSPTSILQSVAKKRHDGVWMPWCQLSNEVNYKSWHEAGCEQTSAIEWDWQMKWAWNIASTFQYSAVLGSTVLVGWRSSKDSVEAEKNTLTSCASMRRDKRYLRIQNWSANPWFLGVCDSHCNKGNSSPPHSGVRVLFCKDCLTKQRKRKAREKNHKESLALTWNGGPAQRAIQAAAWG